MRVTMRVSSISMISKTVFLNIGLLGQTFQIYCWLFAGKRSFINAVKNSIIIEKATVAQVKSLLMYPATIIHPVAFYGGIVTRKACLVQLHPCAVGIANPLIIECNAALNIALSGYKVFQEGM